MAVIPRRAGGSTAPLSTRRKVRSLGARAEAVAAQPVYLRFDESDRFIGFEQTDDPVAVVRHLVWRDAAWQHALTYRSYLYVFPQ